MSQDARNVAAALVAQFDCEWRPGGYRTGAVNDIAAALLSAESRGRPQWQPMTEAPEREGHEIVACHRKYKSISRFVWRAEPHVFNGIVFPTEPGWYSANDGTIIRRAYQDDYLWVPAPPSSPEEG